MFSIFVELFCIQVYDKEERQDEDHIISYQASYRNTTNANDSDKTMLSQ